MAPALYSQSFLMMALANLFSVSSMAAFFLFPLYIKQQGGSESDIGILMGITALSSVLFRPWISQVVDRIGRKRSYTIGSLILTFISLTYLFCQGDLAKFYAPLVLIRILHGVGIAFCFTSAFTYIADIVPLARLNEGIGMFGTAGLMGMAVGPMIAETAINAFGFPMLFVTGSGLGLLAMLFHLPLTESYINSGSDFSTSFFSILRRSKIRLVSFLALLFGVGLAAYGAFVTPYGQELGLSFISTYFIAYSAAAILTRLLGGRLADKVGEEKIVPYALVINGTGLLVLIWLNGIPILVLSGLITGCGHGLLFPCLNVLAIRNEPINIRGKINGIFTGGIDAGVLIGSVALGYVGEWSGFRTIFLAAGLALLFGFFAYFIGRNWGWLEAEYKAGPNTLPG